MLSHTDSLSGAHGKQHDTLWAFPSILGYTESTDWVWVIISLCDKPGNTALWSISEFWDKRHGRHSKHNSAAHPHHNPFDADADSQLHGRLSRFAYSKHRFPAPFRLLSSARPKDGCRLNRHFEFGSYRCSFGSARIACLCLVVFGVTYIFRRLSSWSHPAVCSVSPDPFVCWYSAPSSSISSPGSSLLVGAPSSVKRHYSGTIYPTLSNTSLSA